jgi:hypothetical protein
MLGVAYEIWKLMFNFDDFVNKPAMGMFGRLCLYRPKNPNATTFEICGDFHESFMDINLKNAGADISSAQIVLFVRLTDFTTAYPQPLAGDFITIDDVEYQIVDIEPHIPGSLKLVLHKNE